jgi:ribosomal protein S18 acetylase RimI-like enzyme
MTRPPTVRPARAGDLETVSALIGRLNARPEHRSLLLDETPDGVRRNLEEFDSPWTSRFVVAEAGPAIVGAAGVEWEPANGRSRLMGPFVEAGPGAEVFAALLAAATALVPPEIGTLDAFIDQAAVSARRDLEAGAFEEIRRVLIYTAPLPVKADPDAEPARDLAAEHEAAFVDLHRLCFPDPYAPGEALLAARGDRRRILAATEGARLTGYLAANLEEGPSEGFVQYLGVVPDLRGRGIGRKLLGQALRWFTETGMPQASLTVEDGNTGARGLYESVGFALYRSGVVLRKTLGAASP